MDWKEILAYFGGLSLFAFALGYVSKAKAEEPVVWLSTIARSYHLPRGNEHESNLGLGMEIPLVRDIRFVAGEYKNSLRLHSNYGGATWLPVKLSDHWKFGGTAILVSGYPIKPAGVLVPTWVYENGHFGANISSIGIVTAIQLKVGW